MDVSNSGGGFLGRAWHADGEADVKGGIDVLDNFMATQNALEMFDDMPGRWNGISREGKGREKSERK